MFKIYGVLTGMLGNNSKKILWKVIFLLWLFLLSIYEYLYLLFSYLWYNIIFSPGNSIEINIIVLRIGSLLPIVLT